MAFFRKADAKVKLIFELPKLFWSFFSKKVFFDCRFVQSPLFVQHFNSSAFLSRKRMQNYCFTTYLPNVTPYFFQSFCKLFANSLICRGVLRKGFSYTFWESSRLHLIIITRTRIYARLHMLEPIFLEDKIINYHEEDLFYSLSLHKFALKRRQEH